jgi:hypothetical protein
VRHRQPVDCGMGMTCGSSAHQQLLSGWQVMGALHLAQRVCMGKSMGLAGMSVEGILYVWDFA